MQLFEYNSETLIPGVYIDEALIIQNKTVLCLFKARYLGAFNLEEILTNNVSKQVTKILETPLIQYYRALVSLGENSNFVVFS